MEIEKVWDDGVDAESCEPPYIKIDDEDDKNAEPWFCRFRVTLDAGLKVSHRPSEKAYRCRPEYSWEDETVLPPTMNNASCPLVDP